MLESALVCVLAVLQMALPILIDGTRHTECHDVGRSFGVVAGSQAVEFNGARHERLATM